MCKFGWVIYKKKCIKLLEKLLVLDIINGWMESLKLKLIGLWHNQVKLLLLHHRLFGLLILRKV